MSWYTLLAIRRWYIFAKLSSWGKDIFTAYLSVESWVLRSIVGYVSFCFLSQERQGHLEPPGNMGMGWRGLNLSLPREQRSTGRAVCSQGNPGVHSEGWQLPCSPKRSKSCCALPSELPKRTSQDILRALSDGLLSSLVFFPFPLVKVLGIFSHSLIID